MSILTVNFNPPTSAMNEVNILRNVEFHRVPPHHNNVHPWEVGYTFLLFNLQPGTPSLPWHVVDHPHTPRLVGRVCARMRGKEFWFENIAARIVNENSYLIEMKGLLSADGMQNVNEPPLRENEEFELCLMEWPLPALGDGGVYRRTNFVKFKAPSKIKYPPTRAEKESTFVLAPDKNYSGAKYTDSRVFVIGSRLLAYAKDHTLIEKEIQTFGPYGINGVHICGLCDWWGNATWRDGITSSVPNEDIINGFKNVVDVCEKYGWAVHLWIYGKWPSQSSPPPHLIGTNWERELLHRIEAASRNNKNVSFGLGYDTWHNNWGRHDTAIRWFTVMRQIFGEQRLISLRNYEYDMPHVPYEEIKNKTNYIEIEIPKPSESDMDIALNANGGKKIFFSDRFEYPGPTQFNRGFTLLELHHVVVNALNRKIDFTIGFRTTETNPLQGSEPFETSVANVILNTQNYLLSIKRPKPDPIKPKPEKENAIILLFKKIVKFFVNIFK